MPRLSGSSSVNDIPTTTADHLQREQQNQQPSQQPQQSTTSTSTVAVVRPMRSQSQSVAITMEPSASANRPQQQPARAVSATSCTSDESEASSIPDSLEEGRAPLLRRPHSSLMEDGYQQHGEDQREATTTVPGESPKRRRIPKERYKTGLALLFLVVAGALNDVVLSYIHEIMPETDPLPDIAFRNLPYWAGALNLSEYLMIALFLTMFATAIAHKYRWVVLRRIFTIGALLYLGRCFTMMATQVPKADPNWPCSPRLKPEERTFWAIFSRAMSVLIGLGLNINGRHTLCGDYIYSGHTVVLVVTYLFIREYSPRRWFPLHWISFIFSTSGVICLAISRGHYTIDIIIAYWLSTRIFWLYHTLADLPALRNNLQGRNKMVKTIWYWLFMFMEKGVQRPVPRKYENPFVIPPPVRRWWQRMRQRQHGSPDMDRLMAE